MGVFLGYERWKHQYLLRENVDAKKSQCRRKTRKGISEYQPFEFYSSLAVQIMRNKQSALELSLSAVI